MNYFLKKALSVIFICTASSYGICTNNITGNNESLTIKAEKEGSPDQKHAKKMIYDNEEIILSFRTKNKKEVLIVKDTGNAYIQYRYGNYQKVELEFPEERTKNSWEQFQYNSYWRGGGKQNAGMEIDNLQFTNKGYTYLIYRTYFSENEKESAGIIITDPAHKEIRINGIGKTIKGCICNLETTGLIDKTDIGLSF